jgi:3-hydroxyisobutyrate dehydrogenase-like beta-hydroxyacid dehydrogenase
MDDRDKPRIGFAGLGLMGRGMAMSFQRQGFPLTVWNRTRAATASLAEAGARVVETPGALAAASDFVVTCLADPAAVEAVALGPAGLLSGAAPGLRWIDTSTIGSAAASRMAEAAAAVGVAYLEAPVTGSKNGARDGTLVVMTGGPRELHEECEPVIRAFAARVIYVGPRGTASVMKLIGNTLISFMLEGLVEGAVLGAQAGVPLEKILEIVQVSTFSSPYWSFKGGAMSRRDFETHFSLDLLHKDQALALAEGAARKIPLPGLAAIHQVTNAARALGLGAQDIAAQLKAVEAAAGMAGGAG